ncbi:MAG: hypothetical protein CMJ18_09790 [Phycisphaeraceae bacterium]|nr:hypothetical protein [Phycisphaeraceae bacterium]
MNHKIVINWDEGAMYNFLPVQMASDRGELDAQEIQRMIEQIVDEHATAGIDVLAHSVFSGFMCMMPYPRLRPPGDGTAHVPASIAEHDEWADRLGTFWLKGFRELADAGLDLIRIILDRCHHHGMQFVVCFRMNDRHAGSGQQQSFYPRVQQIGRAHPERLLEEFPGAIDYAYEENRDAVLEFVAEACERYDLDGLELDWMRWVHVFRTTEAAANAPLLTDFIRKCRGLLASAAERQGRDRLLLGVRVAQTLDECANLGYDVATWIGEGLVDYVCPTDFYHLDFNAPIEQFTALTEGTPCEVYPGIHPSLAWDGQRLPGIEEYRAVARNYYDRGAHGVSPYNYMYHWGAIRAPSYPGPADMWPKSLSFLTELRDADRIARGDRRYCFHPLWTGHRHGHCPTGAYRNDMIRLDRSSDDPHGRYDLRIAEDLGDDALTATLEFKVTNMIGADQLEVRVNGEPLDDASLERTWRIGQPPAEGRPLGPHFRFRTPLRAPPARHGDNELSVRLVNRVGLAQRILEVQEFEVFVEVGA